MIGRPEWFTYRVFGWGIRPKTWQGWVYLAGFLGVIALVSILPVPGARKYLFAVAIAILTLDALIIMAKLPSAHDERENRNQLIIERNVSFGALAAILGVAIYQSLKGKLPSAGVPFDTSLLIVLCAMVAVKVGSALYANRKL
jgi:hypothetical protein